MVDSEEIGAIRASAVALERSFLNGEIVPI
jgi:hypothetical protein